MFVCWMDLIETLWNVKFTDVDIEKYNDRDLIETLWNVKAFQHVPDCIVIPRFNRDIVECKGSILIVAFSSSRIDLIETLWNVKVFSSPAPSPAR